MSEEAAFCQTPREKSGLVKRRHRRTTLPSAEPFLGRPAKLTCLKPHEPLLPGISARPSAAEIKAYVAARLEGLELRQQERARLRAQRRGRRNRGERKAEQQPLFQE